MRVYIQFPHPETSLRQSLLRDGWTLEVEEETDLWISHAQVEDEQQARSRLHRLGLLLSSRIRIEFHRCDL
jgi:hypothetical protein